MSGLVAIAIRAGTDLTAAVDPRFGRAPAFLFVDETGAGEVRVLPNAAADSGQGAGVGAAALVVRQGARSVVAGRFGPKAFDALRAAGVALFIASDGLTAGGALERLRAGTLERHELKTY